jgi:branched-chain amino acid transport system substrate-binding protein
MKLHILALIASMALTGGIAQAQQGVAKDSLTVGTIQDLSGPLAGFGKQARNGMQLRVDELNEQGGVHGRKIELKVEDSGYDPKRAVLAAQKLVNQDKVFAMLGHIGTAANMATFPVLFSKKIINFYPLTGAREMFDEPNMNLKFAFSVPYYDQMRKAAPMMAKDKGVKKPCAIYQDDEFGLEVLRGAEAGLKTINLELAEKTSFKRGATDFSSQVAKMKASGCDMVVLGTVIRETIGTIGESRKTGFNPIFLGSTAAYTDLIHKLGGKAMDGLYATNAINVPYLDDASQPIRFWANKYKTKFNEDPGVFSVYGYAIMDQFIQGAQRAGSGLTTDSFTKAMLSKPIEPDIFGTDTMKFTDKNRLGSDRSRLSQIQDGKWKAVSDYF